MIKRVILLVIDGLGIGALPDAVDYGDADANTLMHLAETVDGLSVPNLEMLGLGQIAPIKGVRTMVQPNGSFGRLGFASPGKDSVVGYWEVSWGDSERSPEGLQFWRPHQDRRCRGTALRQKVDRPRALVHGGDAPPT